MFLFAFLGSHEASICDNVFGEAEAHAFFADYLVSVGAIVKEYFSVGVCFFFDVFAEAEEGGFGESFEETDVFEEVVLVVPLEGDLALPEEGELLPRDAD